MYEMYVIWIDDTGTMWIGGDDGTEGCRMWASGELVVSEIGTRLDSYRVAGA